MAVRASGEVEERDGENNPGGRHGRFSELRSRHSLLHHFGRSYSAAVGRSPVIRSALVACPASCLGVLDRNGHFAGLDVSSCDGDSFPSRLQRMVSSSQETNKQSQRALCQEKHGEFCLHGCFSPMQAWYVLMLALLGKKNLGSGNYQQLLPSLPVPSLKATCKRSVTVNCSGMKWSSICGNLLRFVLFSGTWIPYDHYWAQRSTQRPNQ